jgi:glucose/arabinose dehydrogenase
VTDRGTALVALIVSIFVVGCGPTQTSTPSSLRSPTATAQPTSGRSNLPASSPTTAGQGQTVAPATPTAGPGPTATLAGGPPFNVDLSVELFADGLPPLTLVTHAGDGSGLLYAVGQNGAISVVSATGIVEPTAFLDIVDRVAAGGERGLLGLAFHPAYESNGRLFVNYTNLGGDTVVSEFSRSSTDPLGADPESERVLLIIDQPFANHNGGMVAFGTDGYLYTGMGDGGGGGDPLGTAQDMTTLLGKMLRIDVDTGDPYGIPADNPFVDGTALAEIWSNGWRNPWRFSFDRETGAMFVGDVGQHVREEIDAEAAGDGGRNYGWNVMEGEICYETDPCETSGLTLPVAVNDRTNGECAITGGYVYRGANYPDLTGAYVFSDHCTGTLWALDAVAAISTGQAETLVLGDAGFGPSAFGEDEAGELYSVNLRGEIYRLIATPR